MEVESVIAQVDVGKHEVEERPFEYIAVFVLALEFVILAVSDFDTRKLIYFRENEDDDTVGDTDARRINSSFSSIKIIGDIVVGEDEYNEGRNDETSAKQNEQYFKLFILRIVYASDEAVWFL